MRLTLLLTYWNGVNDCWSSALEYGSGNLVGINNWTNGDRNTWDGMSFGFDLDMADVTLGCY